MFVSSNQKDWDDHLPYVMAAYRAHKSTGVSPNLMMLNREINCPLDLMVGPPPGQTLVECPIKCVESVQNAMFEAFKFTYGKLGLAATRQRRDYEQGLKPREFNEGSWVWRWYPSIATQKLGFGWVGPYLIIKRISYLTYRIQKDKESKALVVHVDHLKPFLGSKHPENWLKGTRNVPDMCEKEKETTIVGERENTQVSQSPNSKMPVTIRSRRERTVKPRILYSPS